MKALILLGGLGTRLRPFTLEKPKPLLPVLNRPFFSYQLDQLKKFGVRDVVLALGYQAAHFRRHLGNGRKWGMRFIYSQEKTPLGTGGAIRKAFGHLTGGTFIMNGDVLCDIDLGRLLATHRKMKADGTLSLVPVQDPSAYGLIETDKAGRIRTFIEKPSPEEMTVNTINAGYYFFELPVLRSIPENQPVSIERDVFPKLLKNGYKLGGYLHRGYWSDIGTLKSYWETHMDLLDRIGGAAPAGARRVRESLWAGRGARLHNVVKVQGTALLGDRCVVGPNAVFRGRVCIGARCVIGENVHLTDCVVHDGTVIHRDAALENCLVGERCVIGENTHVGPGQVLANGTVLNPYSRPVAGLVRAPDGD